MKDKSINKWNSDFDKSSGYTRKKLLKFDLCI